MTRSATRIQDKDSFRRLSVVQSTQDPTKYGIVILNPDGTTLTGSAGDAKVFPLSSTSDITNAQKAYDYLGRGKFPIIKYDGKFYLYSYSTTGNVYFTVWNEKVVDQTSYSTYCKDAIQLAVSSDTVTAINSLLLSTTDSGFLRVGKNYGTAYTPSNDGSPASKKYVDDTAAAKVSNDAYSSSWNGDTTHAPSKDAVYDEVETVKTAITNQLSNDAYSSSWDGDTTHAPTKNAVYDKINSIDGLIPSAATTNNQLADKDYVNDGINSVTAYYITKNAQGDQWATYAELAAATTFYSGGVVRIPTKNDYTIVLADENHDNATTRYIYNSGWEYQYTVNETALTQAQLDALNSGITSGKVSIYDGYASDLNTKTFSLGTLGDNTTAQAIYDYIISGKNPLVRYGDFIYKLGTVSSSKVVFYGEESVTNSVNVSNASLYRTNLVFTISSGTVTSYGVSADYLGKYLDTDTNYTTPYTPAYPGSPATKKYVDDNAFSPSSSGTTGQYLKKTAGGYDWANVSGGDVQVSTQANNILTSGTKLWCGTESNYQNLATKDSNTIYLTI